MLSDSHHNFAHMTFSFLKYAFWILLVQVAHTSLIHAESARNFPELNAETLNGRDFKLPRDFQGKPVFLIIGFTKESKKATSVCSARLDKKVHVDGYSIAVLQGTPFFIKGIIKNSIRSSVPEKRRDLFLILNEGKSELARLADFQEKYEDDAYIIGLKPMESTRYEVAFKSHGNCNDSELGAIIQNLNK